MEFEADPHTNISSNSGVSLFVRTRVLLKIHLHELRWLIMILQYYLLYSMNLIRVWATTGQTRAPDVMKMTRERSG